MPQQDKYYMPVQCHQCRQSPCTKVCPVQATWQEKDGITAGEAILKALRAKATKGDVRAAEVLLDRAYGKPKQTHDTNITSTEPLVIIRTEPKSE